MDYTQAIIERDAMLADIANAGDDVDALNVVYQTLVGHRPDETPTEGTDATELRAMLVAFVAEFERACGLPRDQS